MAPRRQYWRATEQELPPFREHPHREVESDLAAVNFRCRLHLPLRPREHADIHIWTSSRDSTPKFHQLMAELS